MELSWNTKSSTMATSHCRTKGKEWVTLTNYSCCVCNDVTVMLSLPLQQESDIEILDGPKTINVTAKKEENPIYNLTINDLVPGLAYKIKVSIINT